MLGAFFDDSGTHGSSPIVAMGGLIGTDAQWDAFAEAWDQRLRSPLPGRSRLSKFHLSQCRGGQDEFRTYSLAERDHLTYLFRRIILDTEMFSVAAAIDKVAWDELVVGDVAKELGSPIQACFFKCIESTISIVRAYEPNRHLFIFIDQGTRTQTEEIARLFGRQSDRFPEIAGIAFAPVEKVTALQGADLIATETFWYAQECVKNRQTPLARPHFEDFVQRDLSAGLFFDRDKIEEVVSRAREVMAR